MSRLALKTSLEAVQTVSAIYTGGTVQLSSDCATLFTPCNNTIKLINVSDGKEICTFGSEEDSEITTCLLSPDSQQLFVAHKNLLLKLWDVGEKKLVRTWKTIHTAPIVCLAYQSGFLATGSADFTVKVWNLQKQQCVHNLKGANSVVTTVSFFATTNRGEKQDGKLLVYGTADGKVRVSNLKESRYEAVLETHTSAITSIRMDEDGKFLIVAGRDQIVTVWNRENYTLKKTIPIYEAIESMEVVNRSLLNLMTLPVEVGTDAADVYFLTGGEGKSLKLWSFAKGLAVHTCKGAMSGGISQIFLRADGAKVSLVTDDHNILFLDGKTLETEKQLVGNNDEILDLTFFGDSELLVATNSPQLRLYELNSLSCTLLPGHTDSVMSLAVARWDSSVFASGSKDNSFRLWKSAKHEGDVVKVVCMAEGTGHTNSITAVKFSTTGPHWIATTSSDMTLKLWGIGDLMRKKTDSADSHLHALTTVVAHSKDISCIDVSPNDKLIATGSMDKTVKVWSVVDRGKKAPVSLELIGTITGHRRGVWDLQFSPYDTVVATASGDLTVKLFSLGDYSCVKTFEGHTCTVTKVCFLPSGLQLLSADTGGLLKMWTIKTSECVKTFDGHNDKIWAMDIKTLGRQSTDEEKEERRDIGDFMVGTGGSDSVWKLWRDTTDVEKEEEAKKRDETVQQEQTLANLMVQKKFVKALRLAVTLNRPHNAFKIVKEIMSDAEGVDLDEKLSALEGAIERLNSDQINVLLGYVVEWNTTAKSCLVGQSVLSVLLRLFSPEELMKFSGLSAAVEALIPYTERHFERLTRLRQQSTFIDYTWRCMRLPDQATLALNNMEADE